MNAFAAAYRRHRDFVLIFVLFVAFRLLAILLFRPGGFIADFSDYDFYYTWGQLTPMGYRAYSNLWTAYPPLFPTLMLAVFELSARIPPWVEPRLFFHLMLGGALLLFECGNLVLIYVLGNQMEEAEDEPPNLWPPLLYALLFVPVYTLIGWFEPMPLFFLLLGLALLLSRRRWGWAGSAVATGLGFLTKLTPILLLPVAIRWLGARLSWQAARHEWFDRRSPHNLARAAAYTGITVAVIVAAGYPLTRGGDLMFSSFRVQAIRPPWQSLWAVLDGFYGYGLVPLDMRNLAGLDRLLWQSRLPWTWIGLAFLGLYLWLYTRRYDWSRPRTPVAFTAASILLLFLYSKGWSPQFLVWVLAFTVLLLPTLRGMLIAVALSGINFVEANVFLILLPDEHWLMVGTVLARSALMIVLTVDFLSQIWPVAATGAVLRRGAAWAAWAVLGLTLFGAVAAAPAAARAYTARALAEHPCRAAVDYLREQADGLPRTLASEQIEIWRDLYPWLRQDYELVVLDGYDPERDPGQVVGERLAALAQQGEFWWIERLPAGDDSAPPQSTAAAAFLNARDVHVLDALTLDQCRLWRVLQLGGSAEADLFTAGVAGGPIHLRRLVHGPAQVGAELPLVLYWQAGAPVAESYTVFTQLLAPDGRLVAQQDNLPLDGLAPTDMWEPGRVVRDPYRLALPADLPAGAYTLAVGLYTPAGRQSLTLADGTVADHLSLTIQVGAP